MKEAIQLVVIVAASLGIGLYPAPPASAGCATAVQNGVTWNFCDGPMDAAGQWVRCGVPIGESQVQGGCEGTLSSYTVPPGQPGHVGP